MEESSTLGALVFCAVSVCLLVFYLRQTRARRTAHGAEAVRIASRAYVTAAAGPALLVLSLYTSGGLYWPSVAGGLLAGGVAGALQARHVAGAREAELDLYGRLLPEARQWWQSKSGAALVVLLGALAITSLPSGAIPGPGTLGDAVMAVLVDGLCAFFFVSGTYTARWARRTERKMSRPLYIPTRRI